MYEYGSSGRWTAMDDGNSIIFAYFVNSFLPIYTFDMHIYTCIPFATTDTSNSNIVLASIAWSPSYYSIFVNIILSLFTTTVQTTKLESLPNHFICCIYDVCIHIYGGCETLTKARQFLTTKSYFFLQNLSLWLLLFSRKTDFFSGQLTGVSNFFRLRSHWVIVAKTIIILTRKKQRLLYMAYAKLFPPPFCHVYCFWTVLYKIKIMKEKFIYHNLKS